MQIIEPLFEYVDCNNVLGNIERGIRKCYKSEAAVKPGSDVDIISRLMVAKNGIKHESILEHGIITASFVADRGVSHEAVRHRVMAVSQESTRYCNYIKERFGSEITVIYPFFFGREEEDNKYIPTPIIDFADFGDGNRPCITEGSMCLMSPFDVWMISCLVAEWSYATLVGAFKRSAQEARSVLPNSLKTEFLITCNVREWRHILTLRTHRDAHPQMRQLMVPFGKVLAEKWPVLFGEFATAEHPHPAKEYVDNAYVGGSHALPSGGSTEEPNN